MNLRRESRSGRFGTFFEARAEESEVTALGWGLLQQDHLTIMISMTA